MAHQPGRVRRPRQAVIALVPLAAPLAWLLAVVTYRESAHGAFDTFLRLGAFCCGAGLASFAAARVRWPASLLTAILATLLVPLLFLGFHIARLAHPARRGAPFLIAADSFDAPALDRQRWEVLSAAPELVSPRSGALRIEAPAGARAAVELHPGAPAWWTRPPASLLLPAAFDPAASAEELAWTAAVTRTHAYLVVVETERLLVQAEPAGVRLTHRTPAGPRSDVVPAPTSAAGVPSAWRLLRTHGELQLSIGGGSVWRAPETAPLGWIRFGETRADVEHGGVLELHAVSYRRWWQAP